MKARFRSGGLDELISVLRKYVKPGVEYVLEVGPQRSLDHNSYYRSVLIPMFCEHTGYTQREAHSIFTFLFLTHYDNDSKPIIKSTADLNSEQFEAFCEQCRLFLWHQFNAVHRDRPAQVPTMAQVDTKVLTELDNVFKY